MLKFFLILLLLSQKGQLQEHPEPRPVAESQQVARRVAAAHHLNEGELVQLVRLCKPYDDSLAHATDAEAQVLRQRRDKQVAAFLSSRHFITLK